MARCQNYVKIFYQDMFAKRQFVMGVCIFLSMNCMSNYDFLWNKKSSKFKPIYLFFNVQDN